MGYYRNRIALILTTKALKEAIEHQRPFSFVRFPTQLPLNP